MKIVFFADTSHPNAATWMSDLVELHDVEVHAVDFAAPDLPNRRINQHVVGPLVSGKLKYVFSVRSLRDVIRHVRPDVVLAYRIVSYGYTAAATGERPLILAGQGESVYRTSQLGSRWFAQYALRKADLIHAWAGHMAESMKALGADQFKIQVLHRGVRTDIFQPPEVQESPLRIVTSRQLRRDYRTHMILQAAAAVRARGLPAELWVCGDGPDKARLEGLARELGLAGSVRFLGKLNIYELAEVYKMGSVYASMVPKDGLSSSLLEAMSAGLVPVVVDNEANRPWVNACGAGYLVPADNVDDLANALAASLQMMRKGTRVGLRNRDVVVRSADRKTNLGIMVDRWRQLIGEPQMSPTGDR